MYLFLKTFNAYFMEVFIQLFICEAIIECKD